MSAFDHVLVIGFGGPERAEDVRPFLEEVTRGLRIPPARLDEVAHHYADTGGSSPYNRHTRRQVEALRGRLAQDGVRLPLVLGMRCWRPFLRDVVGEVRRNGLRRGLGVVLAPHRSHASFDKYIESVDAARAAAEATDVTYDYLGPWHVHAGFIDAQADQARRALETLPAADRTAAALIFTAHSIPVELAQRSRYAEEFAESSRLVAHALGARPWHLAYQSRSGDPRQPWLEPDVTQVLRQVAADGVRSAVLVPIGFLSDHTEVLYDLDIEARAEAQALGLRYARASTVMDHPRFIAMLAELIRARLS
jgi:ferrochelatase